MIKHSEAVVRIVQEANKFKSSVVLKYENRYIDAKSLLGLYVTLLDNAELELHVHGPDEEEAKGAMLEVFEKYSMQVKVV